MPKASAIITRPDTPVKPASSSTIPSVFDLARHHRALWTEASAFDERRTKAKEYSAEHHDAEAGYERARDEAMAIEELIFTRPIVTIADAAALAVHGSHLAESCAGSPNTGAVETMDRAFSRLAILLMGIAKLNPDELGSGGTYVCMRRAVGLPGKEVVA